MSVGSKYRFVIPANIAYGEQGGGHSSQLRINF